MQKNPSEQSCTPASGNASLQSLRVLARASAWPKIVAPPPYRCSRSAWYPRQCQEQPTLGASRRGQASSRKTNWVFRRLVCAASPPPGQDLGPPPVGRLTRHTGLPIPKCKQQQQWLEEKNKIAEWQTLSCLAKQRAT